MASYEMSKNDTYRKTIPEIMKMILLPRNTGQQINQNYIKACFHKQETTPLHGIRNPHYTKNHPTCVIL